MKTLSLAIALIAGITVSAAAEPWFLMGRHGGCVAMAELAARKTIFEGIATPGQFAARLDERDLAYEMDKRDIGPLTMVGFRVPQENLAIMMVPEAMCER